MWRKLRRWLTFIFIFIHGGYMFSMDFEVDSIPHQDSIEHQLLTLYHKGWNKYQVRDLDKAIEYFNQAREIILSMADEKDYSWLVDINESIGYNFIELGRYRQALEIFYENLSVCHLLQDELKWDCKTVAYAELMVCYSKMGLQQIAVDYLLKATQIDIEHFPEKTFYHFANYRNLAFSYSQLGNFQEAEKYFEKALKKLADPEIYDNIVHQMVLLQLTQLYLNWDKLEEAANTYLQFLDMNEGVEFNHEGSLFKTEVEILYYYKKGDYETALTTLYNGLKSIESISQVDPHFHCRMYSSAAELLIKMGDYEQARQFANTCIQLVKPLKKLAFEEVDDIESILKARDLYNYSLLKEALNSEMENTERIVHLKKVYQNAEELADLLEQHLSSVFIPLTKNKMVRDFMTIFETGIRALYELSLISDPLKWTEKALLFSDRSRAILLIEHLMYKLTENQKVADILQKDNQIKHQYDSIFLEMISLKTEKVVDSEIERDYLTSLAALRLEREQLFRNELSHERTYIREFLGGTQVDKSFVREMIQNNLSILTHYFGEKYMYIIALSTNGYLFERRAIEEELMAKAVYFRQEIEKFPEVYGIQDAYIQHLKRLNQLNREVFDYFIGDAESVFTDYLLFVAVDEASVIPLTALKKTRPHSSEALYLVQEHKIFKTYSIKNLELQYKNQRRSSSEKFLAFAPEYNNASVNLPGIPYEFSLPVLWFNKQEVEWLQKNLNAQVFLKDEATLENFISYVPQANVLHLSGHAYAHDQYPELSFFAFSPESSYQHPSTFLRIMDIEKMDLPVNLVFLNGCQTGIGPVLKGEGPESVHRAFAIAGASSLINTLWPINDHSGMQLTKRFYTELRNGVDIPSALRYAQLELIESNHPVYSHPFFWSGYMSYGVPENPFNTKGKNPYYLILLTVIFVILFSWFWRKEYAASG